MGVTLDHIRGSTHHRRHGTLNNAFTYGVDYVLTEPEASPRGPFLFSFNKRNFLALFDRDHGGSRDAGRGADWVREQLRNVGLAELGNKARIRLLAQPRMLGYVFNPVSFWLIHDVDDVLRAVIAEVNNTFGDRHSYLCRHPDLREILPSDRLHAEKIFHVSPFQPVEGDYTFRFHITDTEIGIFIDHKNSGGGVFATFTGKRIPLTNISALASAIRRPFGSVRVVALIYWQALKLKFKGAQYRARPLPPSEELT